LDTYTLDQAGAETSSEIFPDAYGFGHWRFFEDIINDLQEGRPHPISFEEGAKAIRLLNAIYRSAEDHREVHLDEEPVSRRLGRPDPRLTALYTTPAPELTS